MHPLHDITGTLWPECDFRQVGAAVMAAYLGVSRVCIWERTGRKAYGIGRSEGVWLMRRSDHARGNYVYVPGVVFMAKRLGRYADARFDWRQVAPPAFSCDPAETRERYAMRQIPPAAGLSPDVQQRLVDLLTALAGQPPLPGPRHVVSA